MHGSMPRERLFADQLQRGGIEPGFTLERAKLADKFDVRHSFLNIEFAGEIGPTGRSRESFWGPASGNTHADPASTRVGGVDLDSLNSDLAFQTVAAFVENHSGSPRTNASPA